MRGRRSPCRRSQQQRVALCPHQRLAAGTCSWATIRADGLPPPRILSRAADSGSRPHAASLDSIETLSGYDGGHDAGIRRLRCSARRSTKSIPLLVARLSAGGSSMAQRFRDAEHLVRLALLFFVGVLLFLVIRAFFVPADFGELGHFRTGALQDIRNLPLHFAARASCGQADCHEEEAASLASDTHASVGCESCHGALAAHAADPETREGGHSRRRRSLLSLSRLACGAAQGLRAGRDRGPSRGVGMQRVS